MTKIERDILSSLTELDNAVKGMRTTNPKPDLQSMFGRIEGLAAELPPDADPSLLHYLRKRSYEKARLFLQGRDAENARGGCLGD